METQTDISNLRKTLLSKNIRNNGVLVNGDLDGYRDENLINFKLYNTYKPDELTIIDSVNTIKGKYNLKLYPFFNTNVKTKLISVLKDDNYDVDSELYKLSLNSLTKNRDSFLYTRNKQGQFFLNSPYKISKSKSNYNILDVVEISINEDDGEIFDKNINKSLPKNFSEILLEDTNNKQKEYFFNLISQNKYSSEYGVLNSNSNPYVSEFTSELLSDRFQNKVRSPYYLSLLFDPIATDLFHYDSHDDGLMWVSNKSVGLFSDYDTKSTRFKFRPNSILDKTQELLNSVSLDLGLSHSHVGSIIDQTTKVFREGNKIISRGSAIEKKIYDDNGRVIGSEFSRVWTKNEPYILRSNLIRHKNENKINGSILDSSYDVNIYPKLTQTEAKRYMFSIENLAWKNNVASLPKIEKGGYGGRIMWFPPYDLKLSEQNNAGWDENMFLGRPEPLYTYKHTSRSATLSFKLIVDHPSMLNNINKDTTNIEDLFSNFSSFDALEYSGLSIEDVNEKDYRKLFNNESNFFTKLENKDPIAFKNLKDKIKYFHPAFHSMTPEGFNGRLTFLQQCIRPGDTIKTTDENDALARNTSFGIPPICIISIGDYFNTKVVIRDVNVTYDDSLWDLNAEGIGVQPMTANVTLQMSFIGGSSLSAPIEKLQNALTFNFYANTEVYNQIILPENTVIVEEENSVTQSQEVAEPSIVDDNITNQFLGEIIDDTINYEKLLNETHILLKDFYDLYDSTFNNYINNYGFKLPSIYFSLIYRSKNTFVFNAEREINILGDYSSDTDSSLKLRLRGLLVDYNNNDISSILNLGIADNTKELVNTTLKQLFNSYINNELETFGSNFNNLIRKRNSLLNNFRKLFIINKGIDVKIKNGEILKISLNSFNENTFYENYSDYLDYIITHNYVYNTNKLDETFDFRTDVLNDDLYKYFLKFLLFKNKDVLITEFNKVVSDSTIRGNFANFFTNPNIGFNIGYRQSPEIKSYSDVSYGFADTTNRQDLDDEIRNTNNETIIME